MKLRRRKSRTKQRVSVFWTTLFTGYVGIYAF